MRLYKHSEEALPPCCSELSHKFPGPPPPLSFSNTHPDTMIDHYNPGEEQLAISFSHGMKCLNCWGRKPVLFLALSSQEIKKLSGVSDLSTVNIQQGGSSRDTQTENSTETPKAQRSTRHCNQTTDDGCTVLERGAAKRPTSVVFEVESDLGVICREKEETTKRNVRFIKATQYSLFLF